LTKEEFKSLFDKYFDPVRSYLFYRGADTDTATDLAQDVFMRVWEKQMKFDDRYTKRLLFKIAGDLFITRYRREKLEHNYLSSLKYEDNDGSPADESDQREAEERYAKALSALGEKQRSVFLMARVEGLKYKEIAERLNLSVKAVEKRMNIALTLLKKMMIEK